jgi:hypothetical protein
VRGASQASEPSVRDAKGDEGTLRDHNHVSEKQPDHTCCSFPSTPCTPQSLPDDSSPLYVASPAALEQDCVSQGKLHDLHHSSSPQQEDPYPTAHRCHSECTKRCDVLICCIAFISIATLKFQGMVGCQQAHFCLPLSTLTLCWQTMTYLCVGHMAP